MASANPDEVDDTIKVFLYTAEGDIKACYVSSELFSFIRIIEKKVDCYGISINTDYEKYRAREFLLASIESDDIEYGSCYQELKDLITTLGYTFPSLVYNIDDFKEFLITSVVPLRELQLYLFERLR